MGGQQSKTDVLKQVINRVSMDVLNRNSSAASGSSIQENIVSIVGSAGISLYGIEQINSSKINVSSLSQSTANGSLQSDLAASITESISQESAAIGYTANTTNVKSVVENVINSKITNEVLSNITANIKQTNTFQVIASNNVDVTSYLQKNEAEMIAQLVNATSSEIIAKLSTSGAIVGDLTQKTQSFMGFGFAFLLIAVGVGIIGYFGGSIITNILDWKLILALTFLAFVYMLMNRDETSPPPENKETTSSSMIGQRELPNKYVINDLYDIQLYT